MNARTQPPIPGQDRRNHARALLRWLILAPLLLVVTSLCASAATAMAARPPGVETTSRLVADYRPWEAVAFAPVQPGILAAIARDLGLNDVPGIVSPGGCFLSGADCGISDEPATATPTAAATMPTSEATAVALAPTATPTLPRSSPLVPPPNTSTSAPPPANTSTNTPIPPNLPPAPTATPTNTPCAGGCEPDIGTPDGSYLTVPSGSELTYNLSSPIYVDGDADWDLVYYERQNGMSGEILLDLVVLKIGISATGEWFVVFDWGNGIIDANTSVSAIPEGPNAPIPMSSLYGTPPFNTGILIDVDSAAAPPPNGVYDRLSITGPTPGPATPPYGAGDLAEVDAVEILPTPTPTL